MRPLILALLLLAPLALPTAAQFIPEPSDLASSDNDGVGGIERKPPGNVPITQPGGPGGPNQPSLQDGKDPGAPTVPQDMSDLDGDLAGTHHDLGGALAGVQGSPRAEALELHGELSGLVVSQTAPSAPVILVLGLSVAQLPFKGGSMMPSPDLLVPMGSADPTGRHEVPASWPADMPPLVPLVLQYWMLDPSGPEGLTASNALLLISP